MKTVNTFTANIYVGLLPGYDKDNEEYSIKDVEWLCQAYVDKVGLAVTVTPTKFVYTNGNENGAVVGLINYPRFPSTQAEVEEKSIALAEILMKRLNQHRVSIVFSGGHIPKTVMLESVED